MARKWVGEKFHKLTVLEVLEKRQAICLCECGNKTTVFLNNIARKNPNTTSCGCMKYINRGSHKKSGTRIYSIWVNMKSRCSNLNSDKYKWYGARGISVCNGWQKFDQFYKDMGDPPTIKHTLDRIDNDGNYCNENCKWSTMKEQCQNRRPKGSVT